MVVADALEEIIAGDGEPDDRRLAGLQIGAIYLLAEHLRTRRTDLAPIFLDLKADVGYSPLEERFYVMELPGVVEDMYASDAHYTVLYCSVDEMDRDSFRNAYGEFAKELEGGEMRRARTFLLRDRLASAEPIPAYAFGTSSGIGKEYAKDYADLAFLAHDALEGALRIAFGDGPH